MKRKHNRKLPGYFLAGFFAGILLVSPYWYQARKEARQLNDAYERLYRYWNPSLGDSTVTESVTHGLSRRRHR